MTPPPQAIRIPRGKGALPVPFRGLLLLLALCLASCTDSKEPLYKPEYSANPPASASEYVFAPHPLMAPQKLAQVYGAMVDQINQRLAPQRIRLRLEASSSYAAFNEKLRERKVHFALPNPYQTVLAAEQGYVVFGKMDQDEDFRGIILTHRNSPLSTVKDLKGATVAFPAPTALAATMMPELFMKENGLDPVRDITPRFSGTHDSAIMSVVIGSAEAACTWPVAWRTFQEEHAEQAQALTVRWQTGTLPNNGLVALDSVPERVRAEVAGAFFRLDESAEGRNILQLAGTPRFVAASSSTFAPVNAFIERYKASVRTPKGLNE
ncbi:MAG: phosphate/phosphite/phosphonate ABC transporter substrate-binding protein [Desulfovibrio sp.]|nr:phosphate/phosphite/phosphonate ABC transporter substrate-binding protein [Desulfovibrio sp.]